MNTNLNQTVLVYGGTGVQANPLVWALHQKGYTVRVLTRNLAKATDMAKAGVTVLEGDINDLKAVQQATQGVDIVALTIPFFAHDAAGRNAIDAAKADNIKLIVWNTSGLIPKQGGERHGLNVRLQNAHYLAQSGLPHIILQPTVYLENLLLPETARLVVKQNTLSYPTPADKRVHWLAASDMAALMATAIGKPELAGSRFVVGGEQAISGHQLAECFSEALGRPIAYRQPSLIDYTARLDRMMGEGSGKAITGGKLAAIRQSNQPDIPVNMAVVLENLPVPLTPVTDWVRQNRASFTL